ncbi:MAG: hypothetical protein ABW022_11195 [Actinoplanes sp.]
MAISHADHDHPNTPAARAACRKAMASTGAPVGAVRKLAEQAGIVKPAKLTVVPRRKGDGGVVKGLKATAPEAANKALKRTNTLIKAEHDLADVPRMLAYGVRMAWALDLDVRVGDPFNDAERRIVVQADKGEIAFVWREANPDGLHKIFVRNWDSSITHEIASVQLAFEITAHDSEAWDERGNLRF